LLKSKSPAEGCRRSFRDRSPERLDRPVSKS
jgi:hypothetical protein